MVYNEVYDITLVPEELSHTGKHESLKGQFRIKPHNPSGEYIRKFGREDSVSQGDLGGVGKIS